MASDPSQTPPRPSSAAEPSPAAIFEEDDQVVHLEPEFWERHKIKILVGVMSALVGAVGFGWWQTHQITMTREAAAAFAASSTVSDFERVARDFPASPVAAEALLMAADIERGARKPAEAAALLEQFLTRYKDHPLAAGALFSLAIMREEQGRTDQTVALLRQLLAEYPEVYAAPMASLNLSRLLDAQGQSAEAESILQRFGATHTGSVFIPNAEIQMQLRNLPRAGSDPGPPIANGISPSSPPDAPAPGDDTAHSEPQSADEPAVPPAE